MKRVSFILVIGLFGFSAQAQMGKIPKAVKQVACAVDMSQKIFRLAAAAQVKNQDAALHLVQITNLPGSPIIRVQMDIPTATQEILPARMLYSDEVFNYINFEESARLYVPQALSDKQPKWFKGMKLQNLDELKNILQNGLEKRLSLHDEGIFTTSFLSVALSYAIPAEYVKQYESQKLVARPQARRLGDYLFPVIVAIPSVWPEEVALVERVFDRDISASVISHVMTFLEINGHADWYEAVVKDDHLILIKVPTGYINGHFAEPEKGR